MRLCRCGKPLIQRPKEAATRFARRRYCSQRCHRQAYYKTLPLVRRSA